MRRLLLFTLTLPAAAALCGPLAGCHDLQEHRRMRWNMTPGMNHGSDPYAHAVPAAADDGRPRHPA